MRRVVGYLLDRGRPVRPPIHLLALDPQTGRVRVVSAVQGLRNASWLTMHPSADVVYTVSETRPGAVAAVAIETGDDALPLLNSQPSGGDLPCYLSVDDGGRFIYAVNYGSGTISVHPILDELRVGASVQVLRHHGSGADPVRQKSAHPHAVVLSPDGRFAVVPDLGMDCVFVYRVDQASGCLAEHGRMEVRAGAGPRHLSFHPVQPFVHVLNELDSTIASFEWDAEQGRMSGRRVVSTLPDGWNGESTASDIQIHPSGRFAYVSNRGHDSIAIMATGSDGAMRFIDSVPSGGRTPRGFRLDPSGLFLLAAHQDSDVVTTFVVDSESGTLREIARSRIPAAVCLKFLHR